MSRPRSEVYKGSVKNLGGFLSITWSPRRGVIRPHIFPAFIDGYLKGSPTFLGRLLFGVPSTLSTPYLLHHPAFLAHAPVLVVRRRPDVVLPVLFSLVFHLVVIGIHIGRDRRLQSNRGNEVNLIRCQMHSLSPLPSFSRPPVSALAPPARPGVGRPCACLQPLCASAIGSCCPRTWPQSRKRPRSAS